jgi:hypothetical protein
MTRALYSTQVYILHMFLQTSPEAKQKTRKRRGGAQSHRPASESSASCRRSTTRATARRASQAIYGSWGMSSIGSRPKSMRTLATHASYLDRRSTSVAQSSATPCTRTWASSSFIGKSRPSGWRRPHSSSSARAALCTSRSPCGPPHAPPGGPHAHPATSEGLCTGQTRS